MKVSKTIAAAVLAAVLQVPALAIPERDQTVVSGIAKEMFVKSTYRCAVVSQA
jgi:nicotinamidase-related amidase